MLNEKLEFRGSNESNQKASSSTPDQPLVMFQVGGTTNVVVQPKIEPNAQLNLQILPIVPHKWTSGKLSSLQELKGKGKG